MYSVHLSVLYREPSPGQCLVDPRQLSQRNGATFKARDVLGGWFGRTLGLQYLSGVQCMVLNMEASCM